MSELYNVQYIDKDSGARLFVKIDHMDVFSPSINDFSQAVMHKQRIRTKGYLFARLIISPLSANQPVSIPFP